MADGEIESAITRPLAERGGAADKVTGLSPKRSAAVSANDVRHHARLDGQLNRLGIVARRNLNLMTARIEFRNQRVKERYVRRIGEIDPDTHELTATDLRR